MFAIARESAPRRAAKVSAPSAVFTLLVGFHVLYSQLLLSAAKARVMSNSRRLET
jgi:hypothetical protein